MNDTVLNDKFITNYYHLTLRHIIIICVKIIKVSLKGISFVRVLKFEFWVFKFREKDESKVYCTIY